ncbi:MAG TPA: Fe-Mn family superoxide dismutase [Burkholderiales bacterium]|nr:Fe-Mn family superoxide dismutase [Burkholderiales bacterium]
MISGLLLLRQAFLATLDNKLKIVNADDVGNPLTHIRRTLLICDAWKHACYIDYRNARPDYIEAFWQRVNRDFVAPNFAPRS